MKLIKFKDVKILQNNKETFSISWFKRGKSKITKKEYNKFLYKKAINFGLFYIALGNKSIDFASKIGILRIIKK